MPASSSTPQGHRVPQGWTPSQHQNTDQEDFCDPESGIWVANLPEIGGKQKIAEKMDSLIVGWIFGKKTPVETGYVLLNKMPLFERRQRLRSRLRESDLPEPRKRIRGQKLKRPILITGKHEVAFEWSPSLETAVEAKGLRRRKFRALGA